MDPSSAIDNVVCARIRAQKPDLQMRRSANTFTRNLEEALDTRRGTQTLFPILRNTWQIDSSVVDFCSNDILSLGSSGALRAEFLSELSKNADFSPGSGGSRVLDGNYPYLEETEQLIASFHGAQTGLILQSGFDANVAIWTAIPRLGDVIVYDALVHASTHEGMNQSLSMARKEFAHNDIDSFRSTLLSVIDSYPLVKQGKRCILVAVEAAYSMDGDLCPLQELTDVARELFPNDDSVVQFVVDEAHSTGVIGERGRGLVSSLGLESRIAVRLCTFGKAMSSSGAIILGDATVRASIVNLARSVIFSTGPSFPFVAAIRAGYNLMASGAIEEAQDDIQNLVRFFFDTMNAHPMWQKAQEICHLSIPLMDSNWEDQPWLTHIVPIRTQEPYHYWLFFHLTYAGFSVFPVSYPTVPKDQSRLKITFHAKNSEKEVERLVETIFDFVREIEEIEGKGWGDEVPKAAKRVYAWMAKEKLTGFGMM